MGDPGESLQENDAVLAVLNGDIESFALIVRSYEKRLRAYCLARLPASEVDDVMQDVFIKAFRFLAGYDPSRPFCAWFFSIARAQIATRKLRFWRDRTKLERVRRYAEPEQTGNGGQELLESEMARELVSRLRRGLREAVILHYFAGMTVKETAATLMIGESAVKQRLSRARKEMLNMAERGRTPSGGGERWK